MYFSKKLDTFIIWILFSFAGVSLYSLLNFQYEYPFTGGERVSIGELTMLVNNVRTKSLDQLSWRDAQGRDTIFNNDKIFTDNNSRVNLKLDSGNEIIINEESLFKVNYENNVFNLDIEKGSFLANFTSDNETFLLLLGGKEYKLKSKTGKIKISKKSISIISGTATLESGESKINLSQGDITEIQSQLIVQKSFPMQLNVTDGEEYYIAPKQLLKFTWENKYPLTAELSRELDFGLFKEYKNKINQFEDVLLEGKYHLRFFDEKTKKYSAISSFNVNYEKKPVLSFEDRKLFASQEIIPEIIGTSFEKYVISINEKISPFLGHLNFSSAGEYKIKVKGVDNYRLNALWSDEKTIIVDEFPTVGPLITYPSNGEEFYLYGEQEIKILATAIVELDSFIFHKENSIPISNGESNLLVLESGTYAINSYYLRADDKILGDEISFHVYVDKSTGDVDRGKKFVLKRPGQLVDFEWEKSSVGGRYLFEVSRTPNFSDIIDSKMTDQQNVNIRFNRPGELYWRVKNINSKGEIEYSKPKKVILQKPAPPQAPKIKKVFKKRVSFFEIILSFFISNVHASEEELIEWDAVEDVKKYIVEIFRDGKIFEVIEATKPFIEIGKLEAGKYKYRVASVDFWDQRGDFSDLHEIEIQRIVVDREINLLLPPHRERVVATRIKFEWENKDLDEYTVELSNDLSFLKARKIKVRTNEVLLDIQKISKNRIYWRVSSGHFKSKRRLIILEDIVVNNQLPKENLIRPLKRKNSLELGIRPSKTSRVTNDSRIIKIDGVNLISLATIYSSTYKDIPFKLSFVKSMGTVFEDVDFNENNLSLFAYKKIGLFDIGGVIDLRNGNDFLMVNNKVASKRSTKFSIGSSIEYAYDKYRFGFDFMLIGITGIKLEGQRDIKIFDSSFSIGAFYQSQKSTLFGSSSSFGISFMQYLF